MALKMEDFFNHKTVCLTGGTDGIGRALAILLARRGAKVFVIARGQSNSATDIAGCRFIKADLSQDDAPKHVAEVLAEYGITQLNHLIHNAGIGYVGNPADEPAETMRTLMALNVKAPLALTQTLAPMLEKAGGTVTFIGSTLTGRETPQFASYTASKTAISDIARNLRVEWQGRIHVQEINPGPTRTRFHDKAGMEKPPLAFLFMEPEEVANGIMNALATVKERVNFSAPSLLYHAAKRAISGARP